MNLTTGASVDLTTRVGSLVLPNPVMTASGTSGHDAELAAYGGLHRLGAVVVKSLCVGRWPGNPEPRLHELRGGMLNSVGLQGPGLEEWLASGLIHLQVRGARVVASIWGRHVEDYAKAAGILGEAGVGAKASPVVALEVNVSCPNLEDGSKMFACSSEATAAVVAASECGVPRWAKLSPAVEDITEIAAAALDAGAEGLTLVNTLPGLAIDLERRTPALGGGGGGLSGPALHPVALRAVFECRAAFPDAGIVGVGGIFSGEDALELIMAGADAVQVGTATFRDPRAPWKVLSSLERWCRRHGIRTVRELVSAAQDPERGAQALERGPRGSLR